MCERKIDALFFESVAPIKLTEGRKCKLHTIGWGILTDYFLESVKIHRPTKPGRMASVATLRIGDRSGQITCVVKGPSIGLLFGITPEEWAEVENLCSPGQQLFYRYFKNGLNQIFGLDQKFFYNYCKTNQTQDVLVAKFQRTENFRNKFKNEALLNIIELKKCTSSLMDLYVEQLQNQTTNVN